MSLAFSGTPLMRHIDFTTCLGLSLLVSACNNTDDPQLAMCQAVAKQLTGNTIAEWRQINQSDTPRLRTIAIAYEGTDSSKGAIDCIFPIDLQGVVDTAPKAVVLNGQKIGTRELLSAGMKASGELLKGTAANTVAKSKELAEDAREAAGDVADKALDAAEQTSKALQQKLGAQ